MSSEKKASICIGVFALQGDFRGHLRALKKLKVPGMEVRKVGDLEKIDALILPGGESTTMNKLMQGSGLADSLKKKAFPFGEPVPAPC